MPGFLLSWLCHSGDTDASLDSMTHMYVNCCSGVGLNSHRVNAIGPRLRETNGADRRRARLRALVAPDGKLTDRHSDRINHGQEWWACNGKLTPPKTLLKGQLVDRPRAALANREKTTHQFNWHRQNPRDSKRTRPAEMQWIP